MEIVKYIFSEVFIYYISRLVGKRQIHKCFAVIFAAEIKKLFCLLAVELAEVVNQFTLWRLFINFQLRQDFILFSFRKF